LSKFESEFADDDEDEADDDDDEEEALEPVELGVVVVFDLWALMLVLEDEAAAAIAARINGALITVSTLDAKK
jgi:hypothetical protein